jgi:hypothetical protein
MSRISKEKDFVKTSDISLCAATNCYDYFIEKIERQGNGKAIFLIKKDKKLDEIIRKYFAHELSVDPLNYFNFLKEIKTQIYNLG